jgi:glycerophosphoryl diester phosphodiesterase
MGFFKLLLNYFFVLVLTLICFTGSSQTTSIKQLLSYPDSIVLVAAHRGDHKNFPENSLSGIDSCIKAGIDIVEVDVQRTKDKKFVLMHDGSINRTTNGRGRIYNLTLAKLKTYRLRKPGGGYSDERIPTLQEALLLAKGRIILNLDKSTNYFDQLLPIIDSLDARQNIILKGGHSDKYFNKEITDNPDGPLFMPILVYMPFEKMDTFLTNSHAKVVEMILAHDTSYLSKQKGLDLFKKENCRFWYNALTKSMASGYVENQDAIVTWDYLIAHKAFIIQTDYPYQLMQYLINKGRHPRPAGWKDVDLTNLPALPKPDSAQLAKQARADSIAKTVPHANAAIPQTQSNYYTIRPGDTLSAIAHRYRTSVSVICKLNKNLTSTTVLKIGLKIRIR